MPLPEKEVVLSPEEIHQIQRQLSSLRHNVNNHLSLIVAATELIQRKPEAAARMMEKLAEQPQKITEEIRTFSDEMEKLLQVRTPGLE
jgi:predicted  nucleic acid-binding Zn-ribbon protein